MRRAPWKAARGPSFLGRLFGGLRLDRPVFLTGCGRSGTTILGTTLAQHPDITYLNEPRDIWASCYPEADIWTAAAARRAGQLALTRALCTPRRNRRLRARFAREVLKRGRPRLVEKLPINNFRLDFIDAVFPDALFLHIVRNGIEVARSIARECGGGDWYGVGGHKWAQLVRFAEAREGYRGLPDLCRTDYDRGLLEWRLSVETALAFYASLSPARHLALTYEELLARPAETLERTERFIGVPPDPAVRAYALANIDRRSPVADDTSVPASTHVIAGELLERLGYVTPPFPG